MELLTIFLSSLIGLVSPIGIVSDRVAESTLRKQFVSVEALQVRIDNAPTYQLLQGRIDRLRLSGRGLVPRKDIRIDRLELETDPIALQGLRLKLAKPLQAGIRIILKEEDINRALRSPAIAAQLQTMVRRNERYSFLNPQISFLERDPLKLGRANRIRVQALLSEKGYPDQLAIVAEAEPKIIAGRTLQLQNLYVTANGQPAPAPVIQALTETIANRFDLRQLEKSGITARILQFSLQPAQLELSTFVQFRPPSKK
ncbi:DUF2993 domain-containing protein [Myxacorys almedinensis]|uniref:LmeA family phospholipid-binding protein n=1 Tax=Myxacorys almedinensis A TaxID=2690445 RepID=A0A8J7YZ80_9CYAN|nr:DUF2993 domain-containing protein [Myxacorys almedinensis]NDJ16075.1 LmeA family phospholipid-binding protein [Myxacorys almedinensis A]